MARLCNDGMGVKARFHVPIFACLGTSAIYTGIGVVCTSPGSGGVESGTTGSGGGTFGLVAIDTLRTWTGRRRGRRSSRQLGAFGQVTDHGFANFVAPIGRQVRFQTHLRLLIVRFAKRRRRTASLIGRGSVRGRIRRAGRVKLRIHFKPFLRDRRKTALRGKFCCAIGCRVIGRQALCVSGAD